MCVKQNYSFIIFITISDWNFSNLWLKKIFTNQMIILFLYNWNSFLFNGEFYVSFFTALCVQENKMMEYNCELCILWKKIPFKGS